VFQVSRDRQLCDQLRLRADHRAASNVTLERHQVAPKPALQHYGRMEEAVEAERGGGKARRLLQLEQLVDPGCFDVGLVAEHHDHSINVIA